jgi:hypothetical protein
LGQFVGFVLPNRRNAAGGGFVLPNCLSVDANQIGRQRRATSVDRLAQCLFAPREGPHLVPTDSIHRAQRFFEVTCSCIFQIIHRQEYLVPSRSDPLSIEMAFGEDARLLGETEIVAAFSQNCGQAFDPDFCLWIGVHSGGEPVAARITAGT